MTATDTLATAMAALEAALLAETAALSRRDLAGASRLSEAKSRALEGFVAARAALPAAERPQALSLDLEGLRQAVLGNRKALEEALGLQGKLIEIIAQATRRHAPQPSAYGQPRRAEALPIALSVSA
jgi:hypothetical protein